MGDEGTGAGVRGVSGGERKRVTVGIGLVTQPKVPLNGVIPALLSFVHANGIVARGHTYHCSDRRSSAECTVIARSVLSALQVLMLDEPTSGLDSETAVAIMQLMQDLTRQVQCSLMIPCVPQTCPAHLHMFAVCQGAAAIITA